jgi:hypothetical protein
MIAECLQIFSHVHSGPARKSFVMRKFEMVFNVRQCQWWADDCCLGLPGSEFTVRACWDGFFEFAAQNDLSTAKTVCRNGDPMMSTIRRFGFAFALVVLLAGASSAHADTILNYQISQINGFGTYTANFDLPMHPTANPGGISSLFSLPNLQAYVNGAWTPVTLVFSNIPFLGSGVAGFFSFALGNSQLPLYSWSNNSPTMNAGTFQLIGIAGSGLGTYKLTVTPATAVPEPTSFIFLVTGLLALFGIQLVRRFAFHERAGVSAVDFSSSVFL